MKNSYAEIKQQVLEIINQNKHNEVNRKTIFKESGIYMLYVDCFDDDNIIPFYIGQTNNFQERYNKRQPVRKTTL